MASAEVSIWIPVVTLLLFAIAATALVRYYLSIMGVRFSDGEGPQPYRAPFSMVIPIIALLLLSAGIGIIMIPGEEAFLTAAVADLGMGVSP